MPVFFLSEKTKDQPPAAGGMIPPGPSARFAPSGAQNENVHRNEDLFITPRSPYLLAKQADTALAGAGGTPPCRGARGAEPLGKDKRPASGGWGTEPLGKRLTNMSGTLVCKVEQ